MICSRASALARSSSWSLYGCCQKASASSGVSLARLARSSLKRSMRLTSFDNAARLNAIDFVKLFHHGALFALCADTLRRLRLDKCSQQRASSEHAQHIVGWLPIGFADHQWRRDAQCWKRVHRCHTLFPRPSLFRTGDTGRLSLFPRPRSRSLVIPSASSVSLRIVALPAADAASRVNGPTLVAGEHWQRPRREEAWRRAQPTAAKRESLPASRGAHVYRYTEPVYRYPDI
jgi:hypothetical protein